jgi:hypothetical protein
VKTPPAREEEWGGGARRVGEVVGLAIGHHANITDKNKLLPCTDRFLLVAIGFFMVLRVTELPAHSIFFYHVHMCSQFFLFLRLLCTNDNQTVLKMIQQFCTTFFDFE